MAKRSKTPVGDVPDNIGEYVRLATEHPLVRRVIEDADLRDTIKDVLDRTKAAYERLNTSKSPAKALRKDKKLQRELKDAGISLKEAAETLRDSQVKAAKKRKRGRGLGRGLLFAGVAGGLALVASEGLRSKVLDTLFGAEEEFDYTSTTAPAPAPTPVTPPATPAAS
jgi:ferric-dicitrate binding protein FerR (iron transport regulator)